MTADKINSLLPGRKTDILVAESYLGLSVSFARYAKPSADGSHIVVLPFFLETLEDGREAKVPLPFYSTNITDAWGVFERNGYSGWISYQGEAYACELHSHWGDDGVGVTVQAFADTAPLAICRAALLTTLQGGETTC